MERKCKGKEVCEEEKACQLFNLDVVSNLLRSHFPKSEDLHILRHRMSS